MRFMGVFTIPSSLNNPHGLIQWNGLFFLTNSSHYEIWYEIKSYDFITWPLGLFCYDNMLRERNPTISNMNLLV